MEVNDTRRKLWNTQKEVRNVQDARNIATTLLTELEAEVGQLTNLNVILQADVDDAEATQKTLVTVHAELQEASGTIRTGVA